MSTTFKISACFMCGVAIGLLFYWHWEKECACPVDEGSSGSGDVDGIKTPVFKHTSVHVEEKKPAHLKGSSVSVTSTPGDTDRWATRQGVMEVAAEVDDQKCNPEETDIGKWATRQGIMEVSSRPRHAKQPAQSLERWATKEGVIEIARESEEASRKQAEAMHCSRETGSKTAAAFSNYLRENFDVVQLSISNQSDSQRAISIGSGNAVSPPLAGDVEDHQAIAITPTDVHPQGLIVNPFNGFIYVANQLSGTITVTTVEGVIQRTINLQSTSFPGINSPVALAVNTTQGSPNYGKVYVVNSVANTVSVISTNFEVTNIIATGVRPVAIAFHPVTERLYVANLVSGSVTVINTVDEQVITTLAAGQYPGAISINPASGEIYIVNSGDNTISVYNQGHDPVMLINNVGTTPVSIAWHPQLQKMFVVAKHSAAVIAINSETYATEAALPVGVAPHGIVFNPGNELLYVSDSGNNNLHVIDPTTNSIRTIGAPGVNIGLAIHPNQNEILWSGTAVNEMQVMGFAAQSSFVQVDTNELNRLGNYFRYNPGLLEHLKIVVTGEKTLGQLDVQEKTITGKKTDRSVSLSTSRSPQHFQNVYEVGTLKGLTLDSNTRWGFSLPANHSATILLYYKALEKAEAINELIKNHKHNFICQN